MALPQDMGRGNLAARQSRVRLQEIGPRMELEVVKVRVGPSSRWLRDLRKSESAHVMHAGRNIQSTCH